MTGNPVRGKGLAFRPTGRNVSGKFHFLPCHDRMEFTEGSQGQAIVQGTWPTTVPPCQQNAFLQNLQPRMFFIKVKQDRKHRGASRPPEVSRPSQVRSIFGKERLPSGTDGRDRADRSPTKQRPALPGPKGRGHRPCRAGNAAGFFGFAEGRQDLTNESLLIQAVFPGPKRFAQVRSQPRQESLIHLKTRFLGFHQKTRSVTSRPEVRILSSRPIRQTARIRLHQLQPPDSRPHGLLRKISLSPIKQSGSVKHGHGLARGLLRTTIRKAEEFVEGRNQFGHRGRGNRYGSEQTVGKKAFSAAGKVIFSPAFKTKVSYSASREAAGRTGKAPLAKAASP